MKTTLYGILLLVIGFLVWFTLLPSWCNVEIFNQLYKTHLTSRHIVWDQSGFVDTDVYTSIPMTLQEFDETVKEIGMINSSTGLRQQAARGPWWYQEPTSVIYIYDHLNSKNSSYIEGHYDVAKSKGYFHFFTS